MSNPIPSALALTVINDASLIIASPHRNNYAAIQSAVNEVITALSGGSAGQVLQAVDGTDVQWHQLVAADVTNAADKGSGSAQVFTGTLSTGGTAFSVATTGGAMETNGRLTLATAGAAAITLAVGKTGNANFGWYIDNAGNMIWTNGTTGDTEMQRSAPNTLQLTNTGLLSTSPSVGLGYGTGAGGTVSQATSRSTAVTLNTICGSINTAAVALANGASTSFTVNNTSVTGSDMVIVMGNGGTFTDLCRVYNVSGGTFGITYTNNSGGSDSTSHSISFMIIKGVTS